MVRYLTELVLFARERGPALFFRQILYGDLGCASYFIGCGGEAVVVDPRWDIGVYLELADSEHFEIRHVIDTHDHADHVSGRQRLLAATGARGYRADPQRQREDSLAPGDEIEIGAVLIRAIATPGHRPEHLAFEVIDHKRSPDPWMVLTGDSLLVGDIARPDLAYEATDGARALHASLAGLTSRDGCVEVWPAHIGGSLCGGAGLSGKTSSTVGFERRSNPLLRLDVAEFVDGLTANLPSRPPNVERIVAINSGAMAQPLAEPPAVAPAELGALIEGRVTILDSRRPEEFDSGHLRGAINLPISSPGVGTRAGWVLDPDQPVLIVASDDHGANAMASALQAVGFGALAGYTIADLGAWKLAGLAVGDASAWDLDRLADALRAGEVDLIDVREPDEWDAGHVAGSQHVPLHRLSDITSVPVAQNGRTTAVACAAGMRAAFAASLLRRAGRENIVRVSGGGVPDLGARGVDLEREPEPVPTS